MNNLGVRPICVCPLFSNQSNERMDIPENPNFSFIPVIQVDVTTTEIGERVRLDSMIQTHIQTFNAENLYTSRLTFRMTRNASVPLVETEAHVINFVKPVGSSSNIIDTHHINWVDTPPVPDTYTYTLEIRRGTGVFEFNIDEVIVTTRSIMATVHPSIS